MNGVGISVIICSKSLEFCDQLIKNIGGKIGTQFEVIVFDNRETRWGICKVYNHCAAKAKYSYLCFIHEDIIMPTHNWGKLLVEFAEKTSNCGIIGFAGGTIAKKNFMDWELGPNGRYRYYDPSLRKPNKDYTFSDLTYKYNNPENKEFAEVITLDGFFLFTGKEVWEETPFDEERIKGFHCYDADFSLAVAQRRQNYVCLVADIYHFSGGNHDKTYFENTMIFQKKWKNKLPQIIGNQKISIVEELSNGVSLFKNLKKNKFQTKDCISHFIEINGIRAVVIGFIFYLICKKIIRLLYRIIIPKNIRKIIWNKRHEL
ncbi:hypothetical protein AGMMS49546_15840 [Spirochaetia bacterium]|nr:hypothetical protein AGMMS49546_15840 [Spirochaetia bacterium]